MLCNRFGMNDPKIYQGEFLPPQNFGPNNRISLCHVLAFHFQKLKNIAS